MLNLNDSYNGHGFFACCNCKIRRIVRFFNDRKKCPVRILAKSLYSNYKEDLNKDINNRFFIDNPMIIEYKGYVNIVSNSNFEDQFSDYKKLNLNQLKPFIDKYFSLSPEISTLVRELKTKYRLDVNNTCGIRFRGTDKQLETIQPSYSEFIEKAKSIQSINPNIKFLIQTDEEDFYQAFISHFPSAISFSETCRIKKRGDLGTHLIARNKTDLFKETQYLLASIKVLSECQQVIHTSGNSELWMVYFRGHTNGLHQYLRNKGDINQNKFWY